TRPILTPTSPTSTPRLASTSAMRSTETAGMASLETARQARRMLGARTVSNRIGPTTNGNGTHAGYTGTTAASRRRQAPHPTTAHRDNPRSGRGQQAACLERLADDTAAGVDQHLLDADAELRMMQRVEHLDHRGPDRQLGHPVAGHDVGRDRPRRPGELQPAD